MTQLYIGCHSPGTVSNFRFSLYFYEHIFQTFNDTQSAIKQISSIISNSIGPDTTTSKSTSNDSLMESSKMSMISDQNETAMTTEATMTSTKQTPTLTRSELQSLITRNVKGLVRLFNIEWQDALKVRSIQLVFLYIAYFSFLFFFKDIFNRTL